MSRWLVPLLVAACSLGAARADLPGGHRTLNPRFDLARAQRMPPPPVVVPFTLEVVPPDTRPTLGVPWQASGKPRTWLPRSHTVLAALTLSAALAAAGLWLSRSRGRATFAALTVAVLAIAVVGVSCIGPGTIQERQRPIVPLTATPDGSLAGDVAVDRFDGDGVKLSISREDLQKLSAKPAPRASVR